MQLTSIDAHQSCFINYLGSAGCYTSFWRKKLNFYFGEKHKNFINLNN